MSRPKTREEILTTYYNLSKLAAQQQEPHIAQKAKNLMRKMREQHSLTDAEINTATGKQARAHAPSQTPEEVLAQAAAVLAGIGIVLLIEWLADGAKLNAKTTLFEKMKTEFDKWATKKS